MDIKNLPPLWDKEYPSKVRKLLLDFLNQYNKELYTKDELMSLSMKACKGQLNPSMVSKIIDEYLKS